MDVHLTDVSQGLSAFNLAGPRSREILSGLTDLDCSNESFAYLDGKRAHVARRSLPAAADRLRRRARLRAPLPGARSPSTSGTRLMAAGEPHGIRPFGLEPQRVLRLQKLHILVGQDTDAESNPLEAAMPWIVKLDKEEDFIGRWALEAVQERGRREQARRLHDRQRRGADRGRRGGGRRQAGRPGDLVALLAQARADDRDGVGARRHWPRTAAQITLADDGRRLTATGADGALLRPRPGAAARMSFEFLAPDAARPLDGEAPALRSPIEWAHRDAGARTSPTGPAGGSWPTTANREAEAAACRRLGRRRRPLLPGQARAPGRARRSSPRSSPSSPAAARSHPGRRKAS